MTDSPSETQAPALNASAELPKEPLPDLWTLYWMVWFAPRQAIQLLIANQPGLLVLPLAMVGGIGDAIGKMAYLSSKSTKGVSLWHDLGMAYMDNYGVLKLLLIVVVSGSIMGVMALYCHAWLLNWVGKRWFQTTGTPQSIRTALAWSSAPLAPSILVALVTAYQVGPSYFSLTSGGTAESATLNTLAHNSSFLGAYLEVFDGILGIVCAVWSMVILLKGLSTVQNISIFRTFLNLLISAGLLLFLVLLGAFAILGVALLTGQI